MLSHISKRRFLIINLAIVAVFPLIFCQLIRLSLWEHRTLVEFAGRQHNLVIEIPPERGLVLDRNLKEFATNLKVPSIYGVPRIVPKREKEKLIAQTSQILGSNRSFIVDRMNRDKAFVWLKRRTSVKEADQIRKLSHSGLGVTYENKRFYPHGELLANVIGFCNVDTSGVDGLELLYNRQMQGRSGYRYTKRDALGREVVAFEKKLVPAINGAHLILTIDQHIQFLTERALDDAFRKYRAEGAVAIVMNPKTGAVLAMASRPTFDPNQLTRSNAAHRRNRPITDIFEPGSVFKMVTVAAALNEGAVKPTDVFHCENGQWRVRPRRIIHDVHPYGPLRVPEVLINSSNIGTVKIGMRLGEHKLYRYIKAFGFGEKTGIDFPGEVGGILRPVSQWSKISITSIPFGQEVAATAIQMVRAVSVIANGGYLVRPYLLQEIRDPNGVTLLEHEPSVSEQAILKLETVELMHQMLERVVSEGTGRNAAVPGIRMAGKTGTSQKLDPAGGYSHSRFVGSFIGYAPVEDPQLAMIVSIDNPRPYYYGGTVAAPVFREVIEQSLIYLGYVPPESGQQNAFGGRNLASSVNGRKPALPKNSPPPLQGAAPQVR